MIFYIAVVFDTIRDFFMKSLLNITDEREKDLATYVLWDYGPAAVWYSPICQERYSKILIIQCCATAV